MNDLTAAREYFVTFPTDREDRLIVARTPKDAAREVFTTVPEAFAAGMVKVDRADLRQRPGTRFYQSTTYGGAEVTASNAREYYDSQLLLKGGTA
mgnify:CR=1 FL=1